MYGGTDVTRVPIQETRGCLVASIQVDLHDELLAAFRRELLERLQACRAAGVILDLSGVELMDAEDFEALRAYTRMASLMGARSVLVGLRPGVVSALVDLGVDIDGIEATLDLEEAFRILQPPPPTPAAAEALDDRERDRSEEPEAVAEEAWERRRRETS
ncbi:MAG: STAS domain-containing protein [Myxococcales bacterium]|jgi:rsbT antagonist protein RsbS|nr:MAG: STAS domain-containing protein [Myxococcales bacterium]TFH24957.1 MAG: STAS domain-containing protein [Myxococcales bacterium]